MQSIMLPSVRHAVRRTTFLRITRSLATTPDAAEKTMSDALSSVGKNTAGGADALPSTSFASPTPRPVTAAPDPNSPPPVVNIPPADDPLLAYLTSFLQHHGQKQKAARITSRVLLHLHAFTRAPPLPILREAVLAASPALRIVNIKKSMKVMAHPIALSEKQRTRMALKWLVDASDSRPEQTLAERLAREMIDVVKLDEDNAVIKKKAQLHKFAILHRCVEGVFLVCTREMLIR